MIVATYYNEIDPYAVQWLRNLIARRLIPPGDVDDRSIESVAPDDVRGYRQAHFFAGIGGWPLALALAGWPDDRPVWTGSCPCQPYSLAGKQEGENDPRDLWPVWFRLIRQCRPAICFGEQVASAIAHGWLDRSFNDLEKEGYACAASVLPACSVGAPHRRDRLWFVADRRGDVEHPARVGRREGRPEPEFWGGRTTPAGSSIPDPLADAVEQRSPQHPGQPGNARQQRAPAARGGRGVAGAVGHADAIGAKHERDQCGQPRAEKREGSVRPNAWSGAAWLTGADGKARRAEPGIRLLDAGVPQRVAKLRALGNAIVPQVAAAFIQAYLEARP